jgi:sulfur carrier protein ThiS
VNSQTTLNVTVNGDARRVGDGATIAGMLREIGIDPSA